MLFLDARSHTHSQNLELGFKRTPISLRKAASYRRLSTGRPLIKPFWMTSKKCLPRPALDPVMLSMRRPLGPENFLLPLNHCYIDGPGKLLA